MRLLVVWVDALRSLRLPGFGGCAVLIRPTFTGVWRMRSAYPPYLLQPGQHPPNVE